MKEYPRLLLIIGLCFSLALLVALTGSDVRFGSSATGVLSGYEVQTTASEPHAGYIAPKPVLVLYSPAQKQSVSYTENLCDTLQYLKWTYETTDIACADSLSYADYRMVIIATSRIEADLADDIGRLFNYVADGGNLFWGMMQETHGRNFQTVHHRLGIHEYTDYAEYTSLCFNEDLLVGTSGQTLESEELQDVCLLVQLRDEARVYLSTEINGTQNPLFWTFAHQNGTVGVLNASFPTGEFFKGVLAGCLQAVQGTSLYPIINASSVFIDDFPAPQYDLENNVIQSAYRRSVTEFYRDIWWPDMQKAAARFGTKYTCLFIATYDDVVNPQQFFFAEQTLMRYYGDSLARGGHEMGAHGYNHQSLAQEGQVPDALGYQAWQSLADMTASVVQLRTIAQKMFPHVTLRCYVPPSNYLSDVGQQAVKTGLPDLKVISGLYTAEGEEGSVYKTRFTVQPDGVVDFPRVTSGMMPSAYETLAWQSAITLHGVFSHFIHPDDILDLERSAGQSWETMFESYQTLLADVDNAAQLRKLTACEAADAVYAYEQATPYITYAQDKIICTVDGFHGETYFFLRTDATPVAADSNCTITRVNSDSNGHYYMVRANAPQFTILLKGGAV